IERPAPRWSGPLLYQRMKSARSDIDRIAEQLIAPWIERTIEVRLGVDGAAFALGPFLPISLEGKMPDVIVARLFPMLDRQRFAVMLAIEIGLDLAHAARRAAMAFGEADLRPVAPQHQNVPLLRPVEAAEVEQLQF